jgi:hypothetical protein
MAKCRSAIDSLLLCLFVILHLAMVVSVVLPFTAYYFVYLSFGRTTDTTMTKWRMTKTQNNDVQRTTRKLKIELQDPTIIQE